MALHPKHPTVVSSQFKNLNLWRDELDEIYRIFSEVYPETMLELDDARADRIEDLAEVKADRLRIFKMTSPDTRASLLFSYASCSVEIKNPTLVERGMLGEIQNILKKHSVFISPGPINPRGRFMAGVWLLAAALLGVSLPLFGTVAVGLFGITAVGFFARGNSEGVNVSHMRIRPKYRSEAPTWLARNRDGLVTNAIVSAAFLAIGVGVGYLLPKN